MSRGKKIKMKKVRKILHDLQFFINLGGPRIVEKRLVSQVMSASRDDPQLLVDALSNATDVVS